MLTKLTIRNFKRFSEVEIELGGVAVFVGPNNSGKTSALQALALWELGLRRWIEKRGTGEIPKKRPGVTINRRDLVSLPVPEANLLWKDRHAVLGGRIQPTRISIEVIVEGVTEDQPWQCGLEFDYENEETLRCRPLKMDDIQWMPIPEQARSVRLAYLPPMSGLTANETYLPPGAIAVRIGEGRTAEVLRNLCHQLFLEDQGSGKWTWVRRRMSKLFGVNLDDPLYIAERGEIEMSYRDLNGVHLDLSSAGRGLQQTLLILTYIHANPGAVLLLDEPDAHLEILRQTQIYQVLTEAAREHGSQIIAASHSEVFLNEAADRDVVVAFVGKPHRIDDRGTQVAKALKSIGFDQYYQAEQKGWVLYLEGSTDLAILRAFARTLKHRAGEILEQPLFVHYVGNQISKAKEHFYGLCEAKSNLAGIVILDREPGGREAGTPTGEALQILRWTRREIESFLCQPPTLYAYAEKSGAESAIGPLFSKAESTHRRTTMEETVRRLVPPIALENPNDRWWHETKASDAFLDRVFETYFQRLGLPNLMRKTDYHELAALVPADLIDPEVGEKLDAIADTATRAQPVRDPTTSVE